MNLLLLYHVTESKRDFPHMNSEPAVAFFLWHEIEIPQRDAVEGGDACFPTYTAISSPLIPKYNWFVASIRAEQQGELSERWMWNIIENATWWSFYEISALQIKGFLLQSFRIYKMHLSNTFSLFSQKTSHLEQTMFNWLKTSPAESYPFLCAVHVWWSDRLIEGEESYWWNAESCH